LLFLLLLFLPLLFFGVAAASLRQQQPLDQMEINLFGIATSVAMTNCSAHSRGRHAGTCATLAFDCRHPICRKRAGVGIGVHLTGCLLGLSLDDNHFKRTHSGRAIQSSDFQRATWLQQVGCLHRGVCCCETVAFHCMVWIAHAYWMPPAQQLSGLGDDTPHIVALASLWPHTCLALSVPRRWPNAGCARQGRGLDGPDGPALWWPA
jgi:hypothetical protein